MDGPLLLIVIDGFGLAAPGEGNAITSARTPVFDRLFSECPWSSLEASGLAVGLPDGVMGNSEVGHLNIGSGREVLQDIVRIDRAIESGSFYDNEALSGAVAAAVASGGRLHLMGLYSDGCVHSSDRHVHALVDLAARSLPPERVFLHFFGDGRDTPPRSADGYGATLAQRVEGKATVATVCGRYFAMDRDRRWERTGRAFAAVVNGEGREAADLADAVAQAYSRGEGDEFIEPTVLDGARAAVGGPGPSEPLVRPGDAVVFWNYRADRARQLCRALSDPDFEEFDRGDSWRGGVHLVSMTEYDGAQTWPAAFGPLELTGLLAEAWSDAGLRQLHIAETEKYAHVTYFFNGGREEPMTGEERILVPSPKVATYDLQPAMSAREITSRLLDAIGSGSFDAVVLNFANPDMVGHTGVVPATVEAVEVVDDCVGQLLDAVSARGGCVAITADHGNAEQMTDEATGQPHTAHTTNPVPLIVCGAPEGTTLVPEGRLADVAPTVLELCGLPAQPGMTGRSLLGTP